MQQRREQLRTFVSLGQNLYGDGISDCLPVEVKTRTETGSPGSTKARILEAVAEIIRTQGPTTTRDLVDLITTRGIEIGGADKNVSVSVILSRAKETFKSDRAGGGWTLIQPHKEENPTDAPTSIGS